MTTGDEIAGVTIVQNVEPQPGAIIGPYEILSEIGRGGMGEVWKARDTRLDRLVAIKFCPQRFSGRFLQEARAIAAINHPNICTLHDIGPDYLVMEYIEGRPPAGPLTPEEALPLALGIARALEAAHARGIIHRDLKPSNILVTQSGVKLLDFGLATVNENSQIEEGNATLTLTGAVMGTAAYMAPEQARGKTADARSDIFAFGLVLYELLGGRRAFIRDSVVETLAAIIREEPAPLDAPTALAEIVNRCLHKNPARRFQTMAEVCAALESAATKPMTRTPSIAVLPFANMSADKENEYFSDGLAEEILNLLAKIPALKVIARTSSFAFRGKEQDIRTIADTLGVQTILEGSVRRSGTRIRVTAQLIEATSGSHLWSERYDREMTDVFAIQDEIGHAISEALKVQLAPPAQPVRIEAWQNYLKGQYCRVRYTPDSMAKARDCFEQALASDPDYAPAYSGLAGYYYSLAVLGMKPTADVAPLAKSAAQKALALDPENAEAHSVWGTMAAIFDYDWKLAEMHFRRAMAAEPVPPMVRYRYVGYFLLPNGLVSEAMKQSQLALETDPLAMILHYVRVLSMIRARQYAEAVEYARRALDIDGTFHPLWASLGVAQTAAGNPDAAMASLKRCVELAPWWDIGVGLLAAAYWQAGDRDRSTELGRKLAGRRTVGAALYYAGTGETDSMFEALEGSLGAREGNLVSIKGLPLFNPYRGEPRFQSLLERMNLLSVGSVA